MNEKKRESERNVLEKCSIGKDWVRVNSRVVGPGNNNIVRGSAWEGG